MQFSTRFVVLTLTKTQRNSVCRELFTAIFSEGHATESFTIFKAYLAYFDLGLNLLGMKFSYQNESYSLTELAKEILDFDQLLALKTGQNKKIPAHLLHRLFSCQKQKIVFKRELDSVCDT